MPPRWVPLAHQLLPMTAHELDYAIEQTTSACHRRPSHGYLLRVIEAQRAKPPETAKQPPKGSEWEQGRKREQEQRRLEKEQPRFEGGLSHVKDIIGSLED